VSRGPIWDKVGQTSQISLCVRIVFCKKSKGGDLLTPIQISKPSILVPSLADSQVVPQFFDTCQRIKVKRHSGLC
jgi:hypothetical protein